MVSKKGGRFEGGYRNFKITGKDDNYLLLLTKYFDNTQNKIKTILSTEKKMGRDEVDSFMEKLFSLDNKRMKDLKKEVAANYSEGLTTKDCANKILNKYYKITKINNYKTPYIHDEITEVSEKISYYHYKNVSSSLFWNFVQRVSILDAEFIFDISYINKMNNSLNSKNYLMNMETDILNTKIVSDEFSTSKILSKIDNVINKDKYNNDNEIKFFITITNKNIMSFGYIFNDNKYTFGSFKYKSNYINKLAPFIKTTNGDINFNILSKKLKTMLQIINYYERIFNSHLDNYNTIMNNNSINIYKTVTNNKLSLIIESTDNEDVLNKYYIESIIKNNQKFKNININIEELYINGKTQYIIIPQ